MQGIALKFEFSGWPVDDAGAPPTALVLLHTWQDASAVMIDVLYDDKTPTRLPEALWLRFAPGEAARAAGLQVNKMSSWISPSEVVRISVSLPLWCLRLDGEACCCSIP